MPSLSEIDWLYLEMLKLDAAEVVFRRMLAEAHRYGEVDQWRITNTMIEDVVREQRLGLIYCMSVRIEGLTSRPVLNGLGVVTRGNKCGKAVATLLPSVLPC